MVSVLFSRCHVSANRKRRSFAERAAYIIRNERSTLAGNLSLKCGNFLVVTNAALITTKHVDFNEIMVTKTEESPNNAEELPSDVLES